jgi:hypothetical protein
VHAPRTFRDRTHDAAGRSRLTAAAVDYAATRRSDASLNGPPLSTINATRRRISLAAIAGAAACLAVGQTSAKTWLGHETAIERHLKTAQVITLDEIGTGVTRPKRARVAAGEPFSSFTWKVLPPGVRDGYWESYKSEIAAYELDKLLRLRMVPPAVERMVNHETGAAIMWVEGVKSVKELGGKVPSGAVWDAPIRRMLMFDSLIGNPDRNAGNILIGQPGDLILIDHSRAFTARRDRPRTVDRVDGELWDRLRAVTPEQLSSTLSPWMDSRAVKAVIESRKQMISARPVVIR